MFITCHDRKTLIFLILTPSSILSEKYELETPIKELSVLSQKEIEANLMASNVAETR